MKASDLKKIFVKLTLCDKTFNMAFTFGALAELDDMYEKGFNEALGKFNGSGKGQLKAIQSLIYASIVNQHEDVTFKEIGYLLTDVLNDPDKMNYVKDTIEKAINLAFPDIKEKNEDLGE